MSLSRVNKRPAAAIDKLIFLCGEEDKRSLDSSAFIKAERNKIKILLRL